MSDRLATFRTALTSGDADEVNAVIEEVETMDAADRTEIFDDAFEMCLDLYDNSDGYQRQSVVRFVREFLSRQQLFAIFKDEPDENLSAHFRLDEMENHIDQLEAFYLSALDDDDGRVRLAAVKGLNHLSAAYQIGGDDARLDDLLESLTRLLGETSGKKHEHVQRARDNVRLNRRGPSLHEMLSAASDGV